MAGRHGNKGHHQSASFRARTCPTPADGTPIGHVLNRVGGSLTGDGMWFQVFECLIGVWPPPISVRRSQGGCPSTRLARPNETLQEHCSEVIWREAGCPAWQRLAVYNPDNPGKIQLRGWPHRRTLGPAGVTVGIMPTILSNFRFTWWTTDPRPLHRSLLARPPQQPLGVKAQAGRTAGRGDGGLGFGGLRRCYTPCRNCFTVKFRTTCRGRNEALKRLVKGQSQFSRPGTPWSRSRCGDAGAAVPGVLRFAGLHPMRQPRVGSHARTSIHRRSTPNRPTY